MSKRLLFLSSHLPWWFSSAQLLVWVQCFDPSVGLIEKRPVSVFCKLALLVLSSRYIKIHQNPPLARRYCNRLIFQFLSFPDATYADSTAILKLGAIFVLKRQWPKAFSFEE